MFDGPAAARTVERFNFGGQIMKIAWNIVGVVLVFLGGIWFLQGVNLLPGSFMTGQVRWAVYGGIAVFVGIALLVRTKRRRRSA
jgi:hypothetical protein